MRGLALPAVLVASLAAAAPAAAGPIVDRAVECLQREPVCVDPAAGDALSRSEDRALTRRLESAGVGPMFVAVLPAEAVDEATASRDAPARTPRALLYNVRDQLGQAGTYVVVSGTAIEAGSDTIGGTSQVAAQAAASNPGGDPAEVLTDFVDGVAARTSATRPEDSAGDYSVNPLIPIAIVGGLLLLMFGLLAGQRRDHRRREEAQLQQLEQVKRVARDDLVALGDDIRSLDLDIEMPSASREAKDDYGRAVDLYKRAQDAFDTARTPRDLAPVANLAEEGRYLVASARARLEGREPPEHRPPCFFDPRHGPSTRDVEWAPPGGAPRAVPACEADAQRVERGLDPSVREIEVGGQTVPYWGAPAYYGPWAGGFFGGFGGAGFLGGLVVGSIFTGAFGGMFVDSAWAGEGDPGGGDFGGGDFGGGDFGGGDFGGGDFGGF